MLYHDARIFVREELLIRFSENASRLTMRNFFQMLQEGKLTDIVGVPTSKVWFIPAIVVHLHLHCI
jgi:hypothetical protein